MLKLIFFAVAAIAVYFFLTQIKVVHSDLLPSQQRKEINERNRVRNMLLSKYIKCPDKEKDCDIMKIIDTIRKKFADNRYYFNKIEMPVSRRRINSDDNRYLQLIKENISGWDKYVKIKLLEIDPILMTETLNDLIITVNVHVFCCQRDFYFQLDYYGNLDDDIFTLIEIRPTKN